MDEDRIRSPWPPHSYENISYIQEYYESVMLSRQKVDQPRLPPVLRHKDAFVVQCRREAGLPEHLA